MNMIRTRVSESDQSRRAGGDRRHQAFKSTVYSLVKGRRISARRSEESKVGFYTDRYDLSSVLLVVFITLLSALDAFFTLNILALGGEEVNPFMAKLLEFDQQTFVIIKLIVTVFCLIIALIHINFNLFRRFSMRSILLTLVMFYLGLIGYELALLSGV